MNGATLGDARCRAAPSFDGTTGTLPAAHNRAHINFGVRLCPVLRRHFLAVLAAAPFGKARTRLRTSPDLIWRQTSLGFQAGRGR